MSMRVPAVDLTEYERRTLRSRWRYVEQTRDKVNQTGLKYHYKVFQRSVDNFLGLVEQILHTVDHPEMFEFNALDHTARGKDLKKRPREAA